MATAFATTRARIWVDHAWPVLLLFLSTAGVFATTQLDLSIANALFFDASRSLWIGADNWIVNSVIHTGGRWAIRVVALLALLLWSASFFSQALRGWRRPAAYFFSALVLTVGAVGVLKTVTNVDCPWDLAGFGGRFPYVGLFAPRPDTLPHARCFPAAHASAGYALMALYFLAHERSRSLARVGLVIGLLIGVLFGVAQQSRGAHFISHDLWSAFFGWMIPLTLYTFAFDAHLYAHPRRCAPCLQSPQPSSRPPGRLMLRKHRHV